MRTGAFRFRWMTDSYQPQLGLQLKALNQLIEQLARDGWKYGLTGSWDRVTAQLQRNLDIGELGLGLCMLRFSEVEDQLGQLLRLVNENPLTPMGGNDWKVLYRRIQEAKAQMRLIVLLGQEMTPLRTMIHQHLEDFAYVREMLFDSSMSPKLKLKIAKMLMLRDELYEGRGSLEEFLTMLDELYEELKEFGRSRSQELAVQPDDFEEGLEHQLASLIRLRSFALIEA